MSEEEKKNTSLIIAPNTGLAKVSRSLQVTDKIIARSHQRAFELERAHFDTVIIGGQEWMAKNLDVAHFRNGDPIPEIRDIEEWEQAVLDGKPAWCYYKNDPENGKVFGKIYNYHATTDARGLIPEGWRWPTHEEWQGLELEIWPTSGTWPPTLYENNTKNNRHQVVYVGQGGATHEVAEAFQNSGFNEVACGERTHSGDFEDRGATHWWWNIGMSLIWFVFVGTRSKYARYTQRRLSWGGMSGGIKCVRDTKRVR